MSYVHAERAPEALMDPADPWGTLGAHVVEAKGRARRARRRECNCSESLPLQTSSARPDRDQEDRRALSSCVADSVARTTRARPSQLMLRKAAASAAAAAAFTACSAAAAACDAVKKPPATPPPPAAAAAKKPAEPKSMAELQLGLATKQRRVFVTAGIDDESAKVVIEQLTHG